MPIEGLPFFGSDLQISDVFSSEKGTRLLLPILPVHQFLFEVGQGWAKKRTHEVKVENSGKDAIAHLFSCENAPAIQKWIKLAHVPGVLVSDIGDMQKPLVEDMLKGQLVPRPFATAVFCGWVCHQACLGCVYCGEQTALLGPMTF